MRAKGIAEVIAQTCSSLDALGLLFAYNSPCHTASQGRERVSYPMNGVGSASVHPFGALEQYLDWVRQGEFTCLLFDYSLIRASYECIGAEVVAHSLLYWPCPIAFSVGIDGIGITDLCDGLEMCIHSPYTARDVCNLTMRTPMRFDFDPDAERDDHPLVHLHTQFDDARLNVQQAMCFPSFMKKVFRTFYRNRWALHPEIGDLHEQSIEHDGGECDPLGYCFQVSWS